MILIALHSKYKSCLHFILLIMEKILFILNNYIMNFYTVAFSFQCYAERCAFCIEITQDLICYYISLFLYMYVKKMMAFGFIYEERSEPWNRNEKDLIICEYLFIYSRCLLWIFSVMYIWCLTQSGRLLYSCTFYK